MVRGTRHFAKIMALAATFSSECFGASAPRSIEVLGHRGARASRPENTLSAFRFAIDQGVDALELDVQLSKDEHLIVAHDRLVPVALCRSMEGKDLSANVAFTDLTLVEIKNLDCGSQRHQDFPSQETAHKSQVPTLEEVFDLVTSNHSHDAQRIKLQIEAKIVPRYTRDSSTPTVIANAIMAAAKKYKLTDRIVIQSFDHRVISVVKKIQPTVKTAALLSADFPDWVNVIRSVNADILSPHIDWVTKEAVAAVHKYGAKVMPYTANNEADWSHLIDCGVDGIITDDPKSLITFLRSQGLRKGA
ncbi:MAG: hypothetical protein RL011_2008 [Pseudomonadota bacterium]|jgi:glycerophosphoryl diester phosphodiesterase